MKQTTNAVVISHEKEATKRLFSAVRFYIDNMDVKPMVSIDSKCEIQFPKRQSNYYIGTAGQKAAGRGDTIHRAHLSEAAFYDNLERILGGVAEAAEYGEIDIETTPNGREQFYDMWQKAKKGLSSYTPIFIPWFINREYSASNMTEEERNGLSGAVREMFAIPDDVFLASLTDEERKLVARVADEYGIMLTAGEIKWRRYKIWDKGVLFWQEYPEDDESCFMQSGRALFSTITMDKQYRIPLDHLETWRTPADRASLKDTRMFAGVDGAEGTLTGDAHVFAVIGEHPDLPQGKAAVLFELHSNEPLDIFDAHVAKICDQFELMQTGVEKNGVGTAHCLKLRQLGVRFTEYDTTASSRPVMLTDLEEAYRKEELIETYPEAENEARDMIYTNASRAEHPVGKHDDRVFARAIAWQKLRKLSPGMTFV